MVPLLQEPGCPDHLFEIGDEKGATGNRDTLDILPAAVRASDADRHLVAVGDVLDLLSAVLRPEVELHTVVDEADRVRMGESVRAQCGQHHVVAPLKKLCDLRDDAALLFAIGTIAPGDRRNLSWHPRAMGFDSGLGHSPAHIAIQV